MLGWASKDGAADASLTTLLPVRSLGRSPECLAGVLHILLEIALSAGHLSLTCHCQEGGRY